MDLRIVTEQIIRHEGFRNKPYKCTANKLTIGYGRNIEDNGITKTEASVLLQNDILQCQKQLRKIFDNYDSYPEVIQHVLTDMIYNLGLTRFKNFRKMIKAVKLKDYNRMIKEMKDSSWYNQVQNRANNLIKIIELFNNH